MRKYLSFFPGNSNSSRNLNIFKNPLVHKNRREREKKSHCTIFWKLRMQIKGGTQEFSSIAPFSTTTKLCGYFFLLDCSRRWCFLTMMIMWECGSSLDICVSICSRFSPYITSITFGCKNSRLVTDKKAWNCKINTKYTRKIFANDAGFLRGYLFFSPSLWPVLQCKPWEILIEDLKFVQRFSIFSEMVVKDSSLLPISLPPCDKEGPRL